MLVHRQRGTVLYFHQAISEKKIIAIPGIHYFDAHRLDALLLNAPELQLHPRAGNFPEPEGAGDAVDDPSSDEELSTTDGEDTSDMMVRLTRNGARPTLTRKMTLLKKN